MFYTLVAERLGLSVSDLRAWDLLVGLGPLSAREFADLTGLTPGAVTGLIDRLEKAGAVKRTPIRTIAARSSSRCCRNCEPETRPAYFDSFRWRLAGCTSDIQMTKFEVIHRYSMEVADLLQQEALRLRKSKPGKVKVKQR